MGNSVDCPCPYIIIMVRFAFFGKKAKRYVVKLGEAQMIQKNCRQARLLAATRLTGQAKVYTDLGPP